MANNPEANYKYGHCIAKGYKYEPSSGQMPIRTRESSYSYSSQRADQRCKPGVVLTLPAEREYKDIDDDGNDDNDNNNEYCEMNFENPADYSAQVNHKRSGCCLYNVLGDIIPVCRRQYPGRLRRLISVSLFRWLHNIAP